MTAPDASGPPPGEIPLLPSDPARVDSFWLEARVATSPAGVAYLAHEEHPDATGEPVAQPAIVVLLNDGAATDPAARDRFTGGVNALALDAVLARGGQGQESGRSARRFRPDPTDDLPSVAPSAPWVALAPGGATGTEDTAAVAASLLERTGLADVDDDFSAGRATAATAPPYRFSWQDRTGTGVLRSWPLPWPGRHDRAGWLSILAAWVIMMLIAALAVLVAWLVFSRMPPQQVSRPQPTTQSESASASPSPGSSSSPSTQSGSPTPSTSGGPGGEPSASSSEQPDPRVSRL